MSLLPLLRKLLLLMLMLLLIGRRGQEGMIPPVPLDPAPNASSRVALRLFAGSRITAGLMMLPVRLPMLSLLLRLVVGSGISATATVSAGVNAVVLLSQLLLLERLAVFDVWVEVRPKLFRLPVVVRVVTFPPLDLVTAVCNRGAARLFVGSGITGGKGGSDISATVPYTVAGGCTRRRLVLVLLRLEGFEDHGGPSVTLRLRPNHAPRNMLLGKAEP